MKDHQIPDWVREVAAPPEPLLPEALTRARYEVEWFEVDPWAAWFKRLATVAEERLGSAPHWGPEVVEFLQLLDLAPRYLCYPKRYPWFFLTVRGVFAYRRYDGVAKMRKGLRRRTSSAGARKALT